MAKGRIIVADVFRIGNFGLIVTSTIPVTVNEDGSVRLKCNCERCQEERRRREQEEQKSPEEQERQGK